ncbi:alpha/beta fold hydrolase [Pseudonocardia sp. H11422]|uniref:alpha/beta fold hydrolase n=1 Tax=Pseudonocardia sp. H11422 TaxID=2835866 RepID=UPI001BDD76DA|nr:alpha/beta fold hydrolase [Pseudonocardia sp. H11422]
MTRPGNIALDMLDEIRRATGLLFDALGSGPRTTPSTVLDVVPGVRLHDYPPASPSGSPVLLVPAPIKRSYIWDIEPGLSVVARCLEHGLRVHLVEWTDPGRAHQQFGLDQYADRLLVECMRVVTERTGAQRVPLVGHSLGGTFCAVCAARHPDLVTAIALLEAPLHFGTDAGAFTPFVSATPAASSPPLSAGGVPGSLLDIVAATAAPAEFQLDRWTDFVRSAADPVALASYLRVLRWTMDEFRLPEHLFSDVVERLYRADEFMRGTLVVDGRSVGPATLVVPMLNVVDPRSDVVPPCSIMPFHEAAASAEKRVLEYHGDTGVAVQHVGVLVGHNAHRQLWPEILGWLTGLPAS